MIIRCPECSTGFNLPDDRITPDGTKLKCSKCEHVFRVRSSDEEEDFEIYYKPGDNEEKGKKKKKKRKKKSPLSGGGLDLKPKKSSAFGDLDDDEEEEMEAFDSAFDDDEEATELEGAIEEESQADDESSGFTPPPDGGSPSGGAAASAQEEDEAEALQGSGSAFGDPQDHVDPSFGKEGPVFDPAKGKVEAEQKDDGGQNTEQAASPSQKASSPSPSSGPSGPPKGASGPPTGASGPPPTAAKASGAPPTSQAMKAPSDEGGGSPNTQQQAAVLTGDWDVDDLAAHKIGGSTGMKIVTFLLLLTLVVVGFLGVVTMRNDGFIDFHAFSDMVEVAFGDGEYEPRAEWAMEAPDTIVVQPSDPVVVEGAHGELVSVGRNEQIFVVQGMVRNHDDSRVHDVELRAMLTTVEGRPMREIAAVVGDDPPIGEFRELGSVDDVDELLTGRGATIESGGVTPFTMVFTDLPQRVVDGERYAFRVEVRDLAGGSEGLAAQD